MNTPTLRLAIDLAREKLVGKSEPALLVSLPYLKGFLGARKRLGVRYRDWVLDSGAYSAFNSGQVVVLGDYIRTCREMIATDRKLTEVFALDVIGDWKGSEKNTRLMWKAGIAAIPCYHFGEPWDVLKGLARDYPKIALGGVAADRGPAKVDWALRCVTAVWPKKIHGFGFGNRDVMLQVPFHSVDATTWQLNPRAFGQWVSFGRAKMRSGDGVSLESEMRYFLAMEKQVQARWSNEMHELEYSHAA